MYSEVKEKRQDCAESYPLAAGLIDL